MVLIFVGSNKSQKVDPVTLFAFQRMCSKASFHVDFSLYQHLREGLLLALVFCPSLFLGVRQLNCGRMECEVTYDFWQFPSCNYVKQFHCLIPVFKAVTSLQMRFQGAMCAAISHLPP